MNRTIVGLFDEQSQAHAAVQSLIDAGVQREQISLVAQDTRGATQTQTVGGASSTAEGAGAGAVGGTVAGGAIGLLIGAGLLAIPGIGPVLAAGPIAAAIGSAAAMAGSAALGAGIGAAAGGLFGALVGAGLSEDEARYYAEGVRRGGTLVAVNGDEAMAGRVQQLLERHGAVDIQRRAGEWRSAGWDIGAPINPVPERRSDPNAVTEPRLGREGMPDGINGDAALDGSDFARGMRDGEPVGQPDYARGLDQATPDVHSDFARGMREGEPAGAPDYARGMRSFDTYDADFRTHHQSALYAGGQPYASYEPAYRYGYDLRTSSPHDRWELVEADARTRWEQDRPNSWEQIKDAVRYAWEKARGER